MMVAKEDFKIRGSGRAQGTSSLMNYRLTMAKRALYTSSRLLIPRAGVLAPGSYEEARNVSLSAGADETTRETGSTGFGRDLRNNDWGKCVSFISVFTMINH
jgi:hypothetical protein